MAIKQKLLTIPLQYFLPVYIVSTEGHFRYQFLNQQSQTQESSVSLSFSSSFRHQLGSYR